MYFFSFHNTNKVSECVCEQGVVPCDDVLKFDDNDVDCERDDEIVVFVKVGDVFDGIDCGGDGELESGKDETDEGGEIGAFGETGEIDKGIGVISGEGVGREQFTPKQKISTTAE
jgi:hypothetical protein